MNNVVSYSNTARIFSAFADETRIRILKMLIKYNNICVSSIADELGISVSAVSQQCKLLELSGVVIRNRRGQKICYQVNTSNPKIVNLLSIIKGDAEL